MSEFDQKSEELRQYIDRVVHQLMLIQNDYLSSSAGELNNTELKVISFIGKKGSCIMREVAEFANVPLSTLTGIMDKLVKKRLINRERSDEDRRIVQLVLSEEGISVFNTEQQNHLNLAKGMLSALDLTEQDQLLNLLKKITAGQ